MPPPDVNYTTDLDRNSIVIGTAPGVPGKTIDNVSIGESHRFESTADRVSVVEGLRHSTFKVRPISGIPYLLTVNVMESAQGDIAFLDSLYQAGVPFGISYRDGGTEQSGIAMVLGDPPKSVSTDGTTRAYRFGVIDVHGVSGATANTGGGVEAP